jgi:RNA polymerase sigma-70 factor (ECF subfamily)
MEDGFLIRQVLGGNPNAFRMLVVRYQRPLFRFLGGFGLGQAVTEELAQEVFLRAFRSLASFDPAKAAFPTWLFTIAKRLAMNERARLGQRTEHVAADEDHLPAADAPSAQEGIESRERAGRVRRALQALPETLRSALLLAYSKELSLEQIAEIESCAVGTVKSRIFRGKALLRAALVNSENQP